MTRNYQTGKYTSYLVPLIGWIIKICNYLLRTSGGSRYIWNGDVRNVCKVMDARDVVWERRCWRDTRKTNSNDKTYPRWVIKSILMRCSHRSLCHGEQKTGRVHNVYAPTATYGCETCEAITKGDGKHSRVSNRKYWGKHVDRMWIQEHSNEKKTMNYKRLYNGQNICLK